MPFTRPDLLTIIARVESDITTRLTGGVALLKNSLLKILARVFAGAVHSVYGNIDFLSLQILPDKAESEYLDRHAYSWALSRIAATFASGDVIFTGLNGTTVPLGTIVVRDDGVEFETTLSGIITGGTLTVNVEASDFGDDGNTNAGVILTLLSPITDIDDTCTVDVGGLVGGLDEESDESLRARILDRIKNPPAGGSESDYEAVAKAVTGVANAYIYGNQNLLVASLGHVTAVILGESPLVPGASLLNSVQTALDAIKPVTATIHIAPIVEAVIELTIRIIPYTSDLETAIDAELTDLYTLEGIPGGTMLISHIRDAIISAGVTDYSIDVIEVDSVAVAIDDIALTDFRFPVMGTNTYQLL